LSLCCRVVTGGQENVGGARRYGSTQMAQPIALTFAQTPASATGVGAEIDPVPTRIHDVAAAARQTKHSWWGAWSPGACTWVTALCSEASAQEPYTQRRPLCSSVCGRPAIAACSAKSNAHPRMPSSDFGRAVLTWQVYAPRGGWSGARGRPAQRRGMAESVQVAHADARAPDAQSAGRSARRGGRLGRLRVGVRLYATASRVCGARASTAMPGLGSATRLRATSM